MNPWKDREARNNLERGGVAVESKAVPGWSFRVRRLCDWNQPYHSALARMLLEPSGKALVERQKEPDYVADAEDNTLNQRIMVRAFVEGCLADWRGVTDPDGKEWPFNVRNAVTLLEAFPDVYAELSTAAREESRFRPAPAKREDAVRGNSPPAWSTLREVGTAVRAPSFDQADGSAARRG